MIESATGLVLRTRPLTETSLIVHWLTPGFGRLATVAKGARRPKSPFQGKLDLFYLADFSFSRSRHSELHNLREVSLRDTNGILRRELGYLRQVSYLAALIEQTTETETPLPGIAELLLGLLEALPQKPVQPQTVFGFELKLLTELGMQPDLHTARLTPGSRKIVETLTSADWRAIMNLKLTGGQTAELRQFLHGFLVFHLGRIPKSRDAAVGAAA